MLPVAAMVSCPRLTRSIVCRMARTCDMIWMSRPSVSWSFRYVRTFFLSSFSCGRSTSSQNTTGMPDSRARVTASLTQSRIGASLTTGMRQMSPASTFCVSRTSPGFECAEFRAAVRGDLEGLVMRAVLLGLLRHEADVGDGAHRRRVELADGLAEVDDLLVDAGERGFGVHRLGVLGPSVGAVHLAAQPDHRGHRGVHDDITGGMEVRDSPCRIHHRRFRTT